MQQKTTATVFLSLIIPAFNEERRIGKSLASILSFFEAQSYPFEIIIVDDGSSDQTDELIRKKFSRYPQVRLCRQPFRRGKGAAVRLGMLEGSGDFLVFSDADLSVPIETLPVFISQLQNHCDVVIGTRQKPGANIERHQPFVREFMGKVFTLLSNGVLGLRHTDLTCGFKGFRREAARDLFSRQQLPNWSFDPEILYLAKLKGFRVSEIPVTWRNDDASKVRLWRDVFTSFLGLLSIRLNHYLGKYR